MKPVYKCDYCSFMGTEEEVKEHEPQCHENYDMKSCWTCKNFGSLSMEGSLIKYSCDAWKDIPAGMILQHCDLYERKEYKKLFGGLSNNIFGSQFGF